MAKKNRTLDKIIDGIILALKVVGSNDLFFGIFLILEGLCAMFFWDFFPVFVALSVVIIFSFAIEWFFDIIRHRRTVWSVLQQICITLILAALIFFCFLMLFDDKFRIEFDRIIICITTIVDGIKKLQHTIKVEKNPLPRTIFIILSLIVINYGIVYGVLSGAVVNIFTTTMHGVVFIICGVIDIWFYMRAQNNKKFNPEPKQTKKLNKS